MEKREQLGSRLGFIMLSAGCESDAEMYGSFPGCADKTAVAVSCLSM